MLSDTGINLHKELSGLHFAAAVSIHEHTGELVDPNPCPDTALLICNHTLPYKFKYNLQTDSPELFTHFKYIKHKKFFRCIDIGLSEWNRFYSLRSRSFRKEYSVSLLSAPSLLIR